VAPHTQAQHHHHLAHHTVRHQLTAAHHIHHEYVSVSTQPAAITAGPTPASTATEEEDRVATVSTQFADTKSCRQYSTVQLSQPRQIVCSCHCPGPPSVLAPFQYSICCH
jgi:hypothetical protein